MMLSINLPFLRRAESAFSPVQREAAAELDRALSERVGAGNAGGLVLVEDPLIRKHEDFERVLNGAPVAVYRNSFTRSDGVEDGVMVPVVVGEQIGDALPSRTGNGHIAWSLEAGELKSSEMFREHPVPGISSGPAFATLVDPHGAASLHQMFLKTDKGRMAFNFTDAVQLTLPRGATWDATNGALLRRTNTSLAGVAGRGKAQFETGDVGADSEILAIHPR